LTAVLIAGCAGDPDSASTAASPAPPTSGDPQTASPSPSETERVHVLSEASNGAVGVTVTVPGAGWVGEPGGWFMEYGPEGIDPPAGSGIIAFVVDKKFYVYGDPCEWKRTRPDTPATSVTGIVDALAKQDLRDPSEVESIRVGGHPGRKITLRVPADVRLDDCDEGTFATFGVAGEDPALYAQGPGEIDEIWVVNVDGRVVLLEGGYYPRTRPGVVDELRAILGSATFD
jgi:hypothetical protein